MTTRSTTGLAADRDRKAAQRAMWALGDYHRFATSTVWELGPVLVEAARVSRGQKVLDVGAGTGNVALRAAAAGARTVAADLTPENFEAGRRAARALGVEVEWAEGDAEAMPFEDGEFDAVTSCFGVMFAADHQRAADELVRVCRPGGTIVVASFTPEGTGGAFFRLLAPYMPPAPPGALPPFLWGSEEHVRRLFRDRLHPLELARRVYVERAASPRAYLDLFKETFGPMIAIGATLAGRPEQAQALDRDFLDFVARSSRKGRQGAVEMPYEYLLVVGRKVPPARVDGGGPAA